MNTNNDTHVPMMPDLQSSLLCDDVRQERNGKFILIGIFDGLALTNIPSKFPRICIVNRWCTGAGTFTQSTRIMKPNGIDPLAVGKDVPVTLRDDTQSATSVEIFMNLNIETEGTYWIEIFLNNHLRLRYPLSIKKITQQKTPPNAAPDAPPNF